MAKPVIFDDGGSIRIRELKDNTTMDGLIGSGGVFASSSSQQFFDGNTPNSSDNNTCFLLVRSAAEDGTLTKIDPITLFLNYSVIITSAKNATTNKNQAATVTFDAASGKLKVALSDTASGFQHNSRRRYVMDAELIQNVGVSVPPPAGSPAGTPPTVTTIFPPPIPATTAAPASTMVHFVDRLPVTLELRVKEADLSQESGSDWERRRQKE